MTDDLLAIARRRRVPSEFDEQRKLFDIARLHEEKYPALRLMHSSLNGLRTSRKQAGRAKASGMKAGVPDVFLPTPRYDQRIGLAYHGLYIEMKRSDRGVSAVTPAQRAWHEALLNEGYEVVLAFTGEEAWRYVEEYLQLPKQAT